MHFARSILKFNIGLFYTLLSYVFTCTFYTLKYVSFIPCFLPLFTSLFIPHLSNFIYTFFAQSSAFLRSFWPILNLFSAFEKFSPLVSLGSQLFFSKHDECHRILQYAIVGCQCYQRQKTPDFRESLSPFF